MKRLNLSRTPDIDLHQLDSKNKQLIEEYQQELRGVVRYLFKGQVVPSSIEQHCKILFTEVESVKTWTRIKQPNDIQYGVKMIRDNERSINVFQPGQDVIRMYMRLVDDAAWGRYPLWEIAHDSKIYREVPYNGNVYSHLHHQHPWFEVSYLTSLADAGLITPTQKELLTVFHRVHDLPEISNGDQFALDKHDGHTEKDSHAIGILIDVAKLDYTDAEKKCMQSLFHTFEWNDTVFKPGEIINYFRDAINVFDQRHFYAHDAGFALSIFNNYFPRFLDRTHAVTLLHDDKKSKQRSTLPLQDIPLAKVFFNENAAKINLIIKYGIEHIDELARLPGSPFKNREQLISLRQTREKLKVVYGITSW